MVLLVPDAISGERKDTTTKNNLLLIRRRVVLDTAGIDIRHMITKVNGTGTFGKQATTTLVEL